MRTQSNHSILPAIATFLVLISAACGSETTNPLAGQRTPPTVSLTIISGDNQTVPAGGQLPAPIRVQVNTTSGHLSGLNVSLIDPANSGWYDIRAVPGSGIYEFHPTVGTTPGSYSVTIDYVWWGDDRPGPLARVTAMGTIVP